MQTHPRVAAARSSQSPVIFTANDPLRASADAFGLAPDEPLTSSGLEGESIWSGSLIGVDIGSAKLPPVSGEAQLRVNLATLDGTASFDHLTVHADGVQSGSPTRLANGSRLALPRALKVVQNCRVEAVLGADIVKPRRAVPKRSISPLAGLDPIQGVAGR